LRSLVKLRSTFWIGGHDQTLAERRPQSQTAIPTASTLMHIDKAYPLTLSIGGRIRNPLPR
jgi:hypothetical protein